MHKLEDRHYTGRRNDDHGKPLLLNYWYLWPSHQQLIQRALHCQISSYPSCHGLYAPAQLKVPSLRRCSKYLPRDFPIFYFYTPVRLHSVSIFISLLRHHQHDHHTRSGYTTCSGSIIITRLSLHSFHHKSLTLAETPVTFITISQPPLHLTYRVTHHPPCSQKMTYAATPRPHIVRVPRHAILLRFFQLFIATAILILTSYGVCVLAEDGIILTLVAGRPLPPSFHEEDFSTHSHMGNKTVQDVVVLPGNITTAVNSTAVNDTAASAAAPTTIGGPRNLPSLLPKVWFRDAQSQKLKVVQVTTGPLLPSIWGRDTQAPKVVQLPTGPHYWESGREILDPNSIPYNDMNLAKLCPSSASPGAPASAYPFNPNAPSVPGQEPDLHDGMRSWDALSLTGTRTAKSLVKRLFNGAFQPGWTETERFKHREKIIEGGESLRKIFKDDAREYLAAHGANRNHWGSPMKKNCMNIMAAPEMMMWGHLQTVSAECEAFPLPPVPFILVHSHFTIYLLGSCLHNSSQHHSALRYSC